MRLCKAVTPRRAKRRVPWSTHVNRRRGWVDLWERLVTQPPLNAAVCWGSSGSCLGGPRQKRTSRPRVHCVRSGDSKRRRNGDTEETQADTLPMSEPELVLVETQPHAAPRILLGKDDDYTPA